MSGGGFGAASIRITDDVRGGPVDDDATRGVCKAYSEMCSS